MSLCQRRERTTVRRRVALVGIAAILVQALLFGWHHHDVAVPGSSGPIVSSQSSSEPLTPATAEDLCQICVALHQQNAAPIAFFLPPLPSPTAAANDPTVPLLVARADNRGFNARAPPRA